MSNCGTLKVLLMTSRMKVKKRSAIVGFLPEVLSFGSIKKKQKWNSLHAFMSPLTLLLYLPTKTAMDKRKSYFLSRFMKRKIRK